MKILAFVLGLTLVSCGSSDEDEDLGRTTDPIIGVWEQNYGDDDDSWIVRFSANGEVVDEIRDGSNYDVYRGVWSTTENPDFNSQNRIYTLDFGENRIFRNEGFTFSDDFETFTINASGVRYRRR